MRFPHYFAGNMSILPWYFDTLDDKRELRIDDSLQVTLNLQPGRKVWRIHVRGRKHARKNFVKP